MKPYASNYSRFRKKSYISAQVQLPNNKTIEVYGTHLDVYDNTGNVRSQQIQELVNSIPQEHQNILLAADFNEVRRQDYNKSLLDMIVADNLMRREPTPTGVSNYLLNNKFQDCFTRAEIPTPKFTVWNGTMVDFIYLKNWSLPIVGCYVYYNAASDHLPVIMDVSISMHISID